ncbi:hypothetical protein PR048_015480 [Dryococelus australis]|uniref:HAT C-terminal dimerisation domain-containing protein n=1 Tax=Dryococelus australis TaxID=614101 RepID=A0ABQ9HHB4_9NEOP|nr:hypothetical protein PR048_015480 [Dryococelus australis]
MKPFAEVMKEYCGNNYPTASMVIPTLHCLEVATTDQSFPLVAQVALRYLSLPTTQFVSERAFSTARNITIESIH